MLIPNYVEFKKVIGKIKKRDINAMRLVTTTIAENKPLTFFNEHCLLFKSCSESLLYTNHQFSVLGPNTNYANFHLIDGYIEIDSNGIEIFPMLDLHKLWMQYFEEIQAEEAELLAREALLENEQVE